MYVLFSCFKAIENDIYISKTFHNRLGFTYIPKKCKMNQLLTRIQ